MPLVPEQVEADAEVIDFFQKKRWISDREIASLATGINPLAYQRHETANLFGDKQEVMISTEKLGLIADLLKLIDQRLDPFDRPGSMKQWRRWFIVNGLPFPHCLIQLFSNSNLIHEEADERTVLRYWFQHDTWAYGEAILLLAGLDPRNCSINPGTDVFGQPSPIIRSVRTLEGTDLQCDEVIPGEPDYERFVSISKTLKSLFAIWGSGDHPQRNPPSYYLDWASSKGFEISWACWAEEKELISKRIDYELTEVERTTLLKIVVGMAMDKYGYDPEAKRQEATGDGPDSICAALSRHGLSVNSDTIRAYLQEARGVLIEKGQKK
jgi:hypothetical protein